MSDLNDIVDIAISRETSTVTRAGFGTPGIIAEFATSKTTTVFERTRTYSSLAEMVADGWDVYDPVYSAAQKIFAQNPSVSNIMVGREDSGDASLDASLSAIENESSDWYVFGYVKATSNLVTFDADFVASNSIVATVNGVSAGAVVFTTNMETTMGALKTAMDLLTGVNVTVGTTPFRTMTVTVDGKRVDVSFAITLGASQPGYTTVESSTILDADLDAIADWTETQKKIFMFSSSDSDIITSATTDIISTLGALNYDRTVGVYYPTDLSYIEFAWMGETLPYDPGSQTWGLKTPSGVATYSLTSSQRGFVLGKNGNIYTTTGGVDITEEGKVVGGEWIDVIRGLDWLEARIQENVFQNLIEVRKLPYNDGGITTIKGTVQGTLKLGEQNGVLIEDSSVTTAPLFSSISAVDKQARTLPDITFTAQIEGAIQKVTVRGTVTV